MQVWFVWSSGQAVFYGIQEILAHTDPQIGRKRSPPVLRNRAGSFDRRQGSSQHGISSKQPFIWQCGFTVCYRYQRDDSDNMGECEEISRGC
jgi:hypothetical protein